MMLLFVIWLKIRDMNIITQQKNVKAMMENES